jgi:hypothetical protein
MVLNYLLKDTAGQVIILIFVILFKFYSFFLLQRKDFVR